MNDTSVDAKLHLNGKEYPIDTFDIQFQESFDFKGIPVKIFFCKMGKKGVWHGLMTTNTELKFEQALKFMQLAGQLKFFSRNANNSWVWVSASRAILMRKSPPQRSVCCNITCFQ